MKSNILMVKGVMGSELSTHATHEHGSSNFRDGLHHVGSYVAVVQISVVRVHAKCESRPANHCLYLGF
jgi:hypothetical protein